MEIKDKIKEVRILFNYTGINVIVFLDDKILDLSKLEDVKAIELRDKIYNTILGCGERICTHCYCEYGLAASLDFEDEPQYFIKEIIIKYYNNWNSGDAIIAGRSRINIDIEGRKSNVNGIIIPLMNDEIQILDYSIGMFLSVI